MSLKRKVILSLSLLGFIVVLFGSMYGSYMYGVKTQKQKDFANFFINQDSTGQGLSSLDKPLYRIDFSPFWKVWQLVDENFVPVSTSTAHLENERDRMLAAMSAVVSSYGDPYTVFLPQKQAAVLKEQVKGSFGGIGTVLNLVNGEVMVGHVVKDSPAEASGIHVGDLIREVNGVPVVGMSLEEIVGHIRGEVGTDITLNIFKQKEKKDSLLTLSRGDIVIPTTATRVVSSVKKVLADVIDTLKPHARPVSGGAGMSATVALGTTEKVVEQKNDYFILGLRSFALSSVDSFVKDLEAFSSSGAKTLIIDLRDNPGGYIDVAVDIASYFLPKDAVVVRERVGKNMDERVHVSKGFDTFTESLKNKKIVILVNRNSASASEIFAGALSEHGVATLVGEKTFGKGSVQSFVDVGDLGSLKVTVARWFTPHGKTISGTGIIPTVLISANEAAPSVTGDVFVDRAIEMAEKK